MAEKKIRAYDVARTVYEALGHWTAYENTDTVSAAYEPYAISRRTAALIAALDDGRTVRIVIKIEADVRGDEHDDDEDGDGGGVTALPVRVR